MFLGFVLFAGRAVSSHPQGERQEETQDYYRKWLEEDVVYIITREERETFLKLTTDEERENFIEQFWARRDPNPATPENEFREEHYRRIAYANEHFHSGVEGWRTDRGAVYIKFGPPDGIEKRPEGGPYERKPHEGGGFTSTHPFEVWFYRSIPGVGEGIELEFVDPSRTNEYRLAMTPEEKDALLHVPGAGLTLAESFGLQRRYDRLLAQYIGNPDSGNPHGLDPTFQPLRIQDYPLERLHRLYRLSKAPGIRFKDLERLVRVQIHYEPLPFTLQTHFLRLSSRLAVVAVTADVDPYLLDFKPLEDSAVREAVVEVAGSIQDLSGRTVVAFEEELAARQRAGREPAGKLRFHKQIPLEAGRYKLSLLLRDRNSGRISARDELLDVPDAGGRPTASSVILTRRVVHTPEGSGIGDPFVFGKYRVEPVEEPVFSPADQFVQAYFEVYNLALDAGRLAPDYQVAVSLWYEGRQVFPFTPFPQEHEFAGDRLLVYKTIPFQGLVPGRYEVRFRVIDRIGGGQVETGAEFEISGPARRPQ